MYVYLYNIGCVLYLFKVVSPTALMDAKTLLMNAFDENSDGKIDIAEVSSSSRLLIMVAEIAIPTLQCLVRRSTQFKTKSNTYRLMVFFWIKIHFRLFLIVKKKSI